jgi:hypothetical protein
MAQREHMKEVTQRASATQIEPEFLAQDIVARTAPAQKLAYQRSALLLQRLLWFHDHDWMLSM